MTLAVRGLQLIGHIIIRRAHRIQVVEQHGGGEDHIQLHTPTVESVEGLRRHHRHLPLHSLLTERSGLRHAVVREIKIIATHEAIGLPIHTQATHQGMRMSRPVAYHIVVQLIRKRPCAHKGVDRDQRHCRCP